MPQNLERLASRLLCPRCRSAEWKIRQVPAIAHSVFGGMRDRVARGLNLHREGLACLACGARYPCDDGVLVLTEEHDNPGIANEREAARATERDPSLGGINDSFDDLANADGPLKDAILALPWGNGSRYYQEPGYFANVRSSAAAFGFIVQNLRIRPGERLLDLGADLTWSTSEFVRRGLEATAVDINHHLRAARLFERAYGLSYDVVQADMTSAPFKSAAFDCIISFNALHHSSDLEALARNIARILAPGGRLGFVEPYCGSDADRASFGREQIGVGISEHVYLLEEWHGAFAAAGLAVCTHRIADSFAAVYEKPGDGAPPVKDGASLVGLLEGFYDARLVVLLAPPCRARPGEVLRVPVRVENRGRHTWSPNARFPVRLSYHLYAERADADAGHSDAKVEPPRELVSWDNSRADFAADVSPGDVTTLTVEVTTPEVRGHYVAEIDLVHEFISWFGHRGLEARTVRFVVV